MPRSVRPLSNSIKWVNERPALSISEVDRIGFRSGLQWARVKGSVEFGQTRFNLTSSCSLVMLKRDGLKAILQHNTSYVVPFKYWNNIEIQQISEGLGDGSQLEMLV